MAQGDPPVEDFDDLDLGDIDYSDIEQKYAVTYDQGLDDVIVIDNVPVIGQDRQERLLSTIAKRFDSHAGIKIKEANMHIPYGADGQSKGYVFVEMGSVQDAALAIRTMDGFPFDKRHRFAINRFTDIERLAVLDTEYKEPTEEEYKPKEHLRSWLTDPNGRDQLVMCRGDDTMIAWHNSRSAPEIVVSRNRWTESYVQWSPLGTYLATLHMKGVQLWGGPSWSALVRIQHPNVRLIDFSPCERYLVTWSNEPIVVPEDAPVGPRFFSSDDEGHRVAVWEVRTGHLLRTFAVNDDGEGPPGPGGIKGFTWPMLKWSGDDKYCARLTPGQSISVYELPSMALLDKKSIKIEGVVDFEWQPLSEEELQAEEDGAEDGTAGGDSSKKKPTRENKLVFWVPEVQNQPARVTVMAVPSREQLRSKNLFNVSDCKLHWHLQGHYLCVKVDRHTKTKKSLFCNLEIFRMREKDLPVEVIEVKDAVTAFAWEPQGSHFAVISSNDPALGATAPGITIKTMLSFYGLDVKKGDFRLLKTLENKSCNTLFWSPRGRHLVAGTIGSAQKFDLEFFDVDLGAEGRQGAPAADPAEEVRTIGTGEHYGITELEWDPSGRFVATSASSWRHDLECGYAIWDFKGQELQKHVQDRFKQILWRPRPRTLLTKEQQRNVRRNLKTIGKEFEEADQAEESSLALQHRELYQRAIEEWRAWRAKGKQYLEELREDLGIAPEAIAPPVPEDDATEEVQEWIEEILEETEEIVTSS